MAHAPKRSEWKCCESKYPPLAALLMMCLACASAPPKNHVAVLNYTLWILRHAFNYLMHEVRWLPLTAVGNVVSRQWVRVMSLNMFRIMTLTHWPGSHVNRVAIPSNESLTPTRTHLLENVNRGATYHWFSKVQGCILIKMARQVR